MDARVTCTWPAKVEGVDGLGGVRVHRREELGSDRRTLGFMMSQLSSYVTPGHTVQY